METAPKMDGENNVVDMSSKTLNADEKKTKKKPVEDPELNKSPKKPKVSTLESFKGFKFKRVLGEDTDRKAIFVEGAFEYSGGAAVVLLEKQAFNEDMTKSMLSENTCLKNNFVNDVYASYNGFPLPELNSVKTTVIHPATEKHIQKYLHQPIFVTRETPDIYRDVVLPHLDDQQFSLQWVYNILDHKSESERIIFEDTDAETGFILLPDLKWNGLHVDDLYVLAIPFKRGIKSLRDLTADHLPLLRNMLSKSVAAIKKKYGVAGNELRAFVHYLPTFYHFHVHFTCVKSSAGGIQPEHAHLLSNVINNLEIASDYYKRATLVFTVKKSDSLYEKLLEAKVFDE